MEEDEENILICIEESFVLYRYDPVGCWNTIAHMCNSHLCKSASVEKDQFTLTVLAIVKLLRAIT